MIRSTSIVHLAEDAAPEDAERVIDAVRGAAGELGALVIDAALNAHATRGGKVLLLAAFSDDDAFEAARHHPYVQGVVRPLLDHYAESVESVHYTQGLVTLQDPEITEYVQRTLLIRVDPRIDPARVHDFESDLADMPRYIDAIVNSSLSRIDDVHRPHGQPWTHVWEQEFASMEDFSGPYMLHAYHWAFVDTWFDPQNPNQIVDTTPIHAACHLQRSILALA
jgi:hypothetical protein